MHSEQGVGTTFKIHLPRCEEEEPAPQDTKIVEVMPFGGETVLVVEDDAGVRDLAQLVLKRQGYTVLEAKDGQEALQLVAGHRGPIHLLLSDVVMPGLDGKSLAEVLAETLPDLRIMFMSGYTDVAIGHHGVLETGRAFLQKPFSPMTLARRVRAVLDD